MGLVRYIVKGIEAPKEEFDDLVSEGTNWINKKHKHMMKIKKLNFQHIQQDA